VGSAGPTRAETARPGAISAAALSLTAALETPDMFSITTKARRMIAGLLLGCVCVIAAAIFFTGGCGDTRENRQQISQHTKDLAAKVKAAPDSVEGKAAMTELIKILNGNWGFARSQVCYAIRDVELGSLAVPAVPDLMRAASGDDRFVEEAAVRALGSIGPAAAPAVDLLMDKVEMGISGKSTKGVVWYAARALGDIGEPAIKAIPLLERASRVKFDFLAEDATKSLENLQRLKNNN
jgi:HEAT repeat protein